MERQIEFQNSHGETLSGTLHLPDAATPAGVVFGHCFTCSRHTSILRQIASDLGRKGVAALRFDFSGNGQSQGEFSESTYSKQISEMELAADILADQGVTWIGLAGHSLGAVVAVLTASRDRRFGAVCAIAGRLFGLRPRHFLSPIQLEELDKSGRVHFESRGRALRLDRGFFSDADAYDLPGTVASLDLPMLVVHGDRDEVVPVEEAIKAHDVNPSGVELVVVPGGDHMFSDVDGRRALSARIVDWFLKQSGIRQDARIDALS